MDTTQQQQLWDRQHAERGSTNGPEGNGLVDIPNKSGILFANMLQPGSVIAEVGTANGRDARYWASL